MSRPIKLTEEMVEALKIEFADFITQKLFDGRVSFNKVFTFTGDSGKARVKFTPMAFAKMTILVQQFTSEVAWHGVVHRNETEQNLFTITDILVYPQRVTGVTVNTDQGPYETWLYKHPDDVFNNIRMQGHSHVNMPTGPSGTDLEHQESILKQVCEDDYYIFMIWNKKFEHNIKIYDMKNNILYENADVVVQIGEDGVDLDGFLKDSREMVKYGYQNYTPASTNKVTTSQKPAATQQNTQGGQGATPPAQPPISVVTPQKTSGQTQPVKAKEKPKAAIGRGWSGRGSYSGEYDDDYPYENY